MMEDQPSTVPAVAEETKTSTTAATAVAPEPAPAPVPAPASAPTSAPENGGAAVAVAAATPSATPSMQPPPAPEAVETSTPIAQEPSKAAAAAQLSDGPPASPLQELWATAQSHAHDEIWGVTLADPSTHVPTQIVLQKYLNANDGDVALARDQLAKTLDWRQKTQPLKLITQSFSREKFGELGYVTAYEKDGAREIFTWNIYGNVKSLDATFGVLDEFIKWRVALMELAVQSLSLSTATVPIGADPAADPYKIFQVHDYKGVSFLRQAPQVKAASMETIRVFATAYPELLKEKFFVNVPAVMGFMYAFMKLFVAARTIKKFHPMSNGQGLAKEDFGGSKLPVGEMLPPEYGGKGADLKTQGTEPSLE